MKPIKAALITLGVASFGYVILAGANSIMLLNDDGKIQDPLPPGSSWSNDFNNGIALYAEDHDKGKALIEKGLTGCKNQTGILEQMTMHRKYANLLYDYHQREQGDHQIQEVINLCGTPKTQQEGAALSLVYS